MNDHYDILALGECLVDFVCTEAAGKLHLEGNPGGAPANVLAIAAKLGLSTALISKVGADHFGAFLRGHLLAAGIGAGYLLEDPLHPTTLAIVRLDEAGNRDFTFYRDRTADVMLSREELPLSAIRAARVLHFGSLSLTCEPSRAATLAAVQAARDAGVTVSYDPNLRPPLWPDLDQARAQLLAGMALADLAKVSDEELTFLTGEQTLDAGAQKLFAHTPLRLLAVTRGPLGCVLYTRDASLSAPTFDTACVDTTGAGDAFWGAALTWLLEHGMAPDALTRAEMAALLDFANAAGSLATTQYGAIPAMPDRAAIARCIATVPRLIRPEA